jgi:hypothetical protein
MGKRSATEPDIARSLATATFTAAAQVSAGVEMDGPCSVTVGGSGWTATVVLERSFDGGATYVPLLVDGYQTAAVFTVPGSLDVYGTGEPGVLLRARCSAHTLGSIPVRLSR